MKRAAGTVELPYRRHGVSALRNASLSGRRHRPTPVGDGSVVETPFSRRARMVVKRIGPMSCAKLAGTLYGIVGLCIGAVLSLVSLVGGFAGQSGDSAAFAAIFGVMAIVIVPVLYGGMGFVTTLIGAALYNVLAGVVGGVEIDLA
jgi:hypothetical protein